MIETGGPLINDGEFARRNSQIQHRSFFIYRELEIISRYRIEPKKKTKYTDVQITPKGESNLTLLFQSFIWSIICNFSRTY